MSTPHDPETISALPTLAEVEAFMLRWAKRYRSLPGHAETIVSFTPSPEGKVKYRAAVFTDWSHVNYESYTPAGLFDALRDFKVNKAADLRTKAAEMLAEAEKLEGKESA